VRGFHIVDCDQLQQMHLNECVTAHGSGAACRASTALEQRIDCFKKAIEGTTTGKRNLDDSLVEGLSYGDVLVRWKTYCQQLRDAALKIANCHWQLQATKALEAQRGIQVQSGPYPDDQVQQLRQE